VQHVELVGLRNDLASQTALVTLEHARSIALGHEIGERLSGELFAAPPEKRDESIVDVDDDAVANHAKREDPGHRRIITIG